VRWSEADASSDGVIEKRSTGRSCGGEGAMVWERNWAGRRGVVLAVEGIRVEFAASAVEVDIAVGDAVRKGVEESSMAELD
jgi:hypothetical protein